MEVFSGGVPLGLSWSEGRGLHSRLPKTGVQGRVWCQLPSRDAATGRPATCLREDLGLPNSGRLLEA